MLRKVILCSSILSSTLTFAATESQQEQFDKMVHAYLMDHPEVIIESVNQYQAKQAQNSQIEAEKYAKTHIKEIIGDKSIPTLGNPNAPITIVEFMDYRCGYCRKAHDVCEQSALWRLPISSINMYLPALAGRREGPYSLARRSPITGI